MGSEDVSGRIVFPVQRPLTDNQTNHGLYIALMFHTLISRANYIRRVYLPYANRIAYIIIYPCVLKHRRSFRRTQ
jgi:hypothetical protein